MRHPTKFMLAVGIPCSLVLTGQTAQASAVIDGGRAAPNATSVAPRGAHAQSPAGTALAGSGRRTAPGGRVLAGGDPCTLYDNGLPNGVNGYSNATAGVFGARRTLLDDFVVPPDQEWWIEDFHWHHIWNTLPPGSGQSVELTLWSDAGGAPGAPLQDFVVLNYTEMGTGQTFFSREEAVSWAILERVLLPPGHYWFEATIVGPENNFWLTADQQMNECWVNYDDLGGLQPGSVIFGVPSDISWCLSGIAHPIGGGACCFPDGFCLDVSGPDECNALGGAYQGDGTLCADIVCPIVIGACCFADGSCQDLLQIECEKLGGVFQGEGTSCRDVDCGPSIGACCIQQQCIDNVREKDCLLEGGIFQGNGSTCDMVDCVAMGACCLPAVETRRGPVLPDPPCVITTRENCLAVLMGVYLGDGVPCQSAIIEPIHTATQWTHTIRIISNCPEPCDDCDDGFVERCNGSDICHDCLTPDGECVCVFEGACDPNQACPDGNCPPGFFCCTNTCCGFPICLPVCDAAAPPPLPPGVRTSGGDRRLGRAGIGCIEGPFEVDPWVTSGSGANCEDFSSPDACPIPADFFGPGSDPFTGQICFRGVPIGPIDLGFGLLDFGEADTLVKRSADPFSRCEPVFGETRTVDIELVALNLVSIDPVTVTFNGGQKPELWDVEVHLSDSVAQPGGTLSATKEHCNGGTYDSVLSVCPKFVFTKVSDPQVQVELDFCTSCDASGITMETAGDNWVHEPAVNVNIIQPVCTEFFPGLQDTEPTQDCDCNANGVADPCDLPGDVNGDGVRNFADLLIILGNWNNPGGLGDVNCDGTVSFADLLEVLGNWD